MGWTDLDTLAPQKSTSGGWTGGFSDPSQDIERMYGAGDTKDVRQPDGSIKRLPMITNETTGQQHEIAFGQPTRGHSPLSNSPEAQRRAFTQKTLSDPNYRKGMEEWIRTEGARQPLREIAKHTPFMQPIADAYYGGAYPDPVNPERTTESVLGFQPTQGVIPSAVNAAYRVASNPNATVNNAVYGLGGMIQTGLETAAGYDKTKTIGKFAGELAEPIETSLGLADVKEAYKTGKADFTYPKARGMYEQDLLNTGLLASGALKGALGTGAKGVAATGELFKSGPDMAKAGKIVNSTLDRVAPKAGTINRHTSKIFENEAAANTQAVEYLHDPRNADVLRINGEQVKPSELNVATQFQAVENGIEKQLKKQNEILQQATGKGVEFSTQPLVDFWTNVKKQAEKGVKGKSIIALADEQLNILNEKGAAYSLEGALDDLTSLNDQLRGGGIPIDNSVKGVLGKEAKLRRELLDEAVMSSDSPFLADVRKDMGALINLRERTGRLLVKQAKSQKTGGILDEAAGSYALAQMAYGAITGSPASVAKGATMYLGKKYHKWAKDPDVNIKSMHEDYAKYRDKTVKEPEKVEGEVVPEQPKPLGLPAPATIIEGEIVPQPQMNVGQDLRLPLNRQGIVQGQGMPNGNLPIEPLTNQAGPELRGQNRTLPAVRPVTERGFQRAGIDYAIEGEYIPPAPKRKEFGNKQISNPIDPEPSALLEWQNDPAKLDPRLTVDGAFEEYWKAAEAGDKPTANFWEDKMKEAMKKAGLPVAAVTTYLAMDDDQRKSVGLLGAIGMTSLAGKGSEPKFYSQLQRSLNDIVPKGKSIVGTPDVQLKGTGAALDAMYREFKKTGGGLKGAKEVLKKYAVPAAGTAILLKYLTSDDETRRKMVSLPAMAKAAKQIPN